MVKEKKLSIIKKRGLQELSVLNEISKTLSPSLDLKESVQKVMDILSKEFGMEYGTITLLDPETSEVAVQATHGIGAVATEESSHPTGEAATRKVIASGKPVVVLGGSREALFLDKVKSRDLTKSSVAFFCIPIRLENRTIGALAVDHLFEEGTSFEEELRLLTVISSIVAQAVQIRQLVKEKERFLRLENDQLRTELKKHFRPDNILGESKRMIDVFSSIDLASHTKAAVLLRGEAGTGKELVAHTIHYQSERAGHPFIKVSCAAFPEMLLERELFGYAPGAFEGAVSDQQGCFELAARGTLFLEDVEAVGKATQMKLLHVIQTKEFERVGGALPLRADVRLITATNKDLEKEVKEGRFREGLYDRLNTVSIFLPPLRERKEDIPFLVQYFLKKSNVENKREVKHLSKEAWDYVMNYSWPGNVRELGNAIERAAVICKGDTVAREHFPIDLEAKIDFPSGDSDGHDQSENLLKAVELLERRMIADALQQTSGNKRRASKVLGITERILGYKVQKYGI